MLIASRRETVLEIKLYGDVDVSPDQGEGYGVYNIVALTQEKDEPLGPTIRRFCRQGKLVLVYRSEHTTPRFISTHGRQPKGFMNAVFNSLPQKAA